MRPRSWMWSWTWSWTTPSLILALAGIAPAAAQDMTDSSEYWTDGYAPEDRGRRRERRENPGSLDEAQASGQSLVIGGGFVGPRTVPEVYTVRRGDTLWDITGNFYGNPWEWPRVWSYNPEITNPHWIYPLDRLRLLPAGQAAARLPTGSGGSRVISARRPDEPESILLRDQGFLDRDALRNVGTVAGSPEEHMLLSPYDEVYVQFAEGGDVRAGQEYTVFRMMEGSERDPNEQGVLVRVFGSVLVRSYDRDNRVARAVITEALDPIERGMRVAAIPRRFENVAPARNQVDLDAQVIATLRPQYLVGQYQIVFVNAGSEHGVRPGNRFFVIHQGDEWRQNMQTDDERDMGAATALPAEPEYPPEVVAEARVVHVRPRTSALIVARQTEVVEIGDRVEMRRGY